MPTFTTSDGVSLSYADRGEGRPILFLASWAFAGRSWDYQTTPLIAEGFRCVTLDRRGHGRSDDPGRGYGMDRLADDVGELLVRLDLRDATLVGFSMGCAEAIRTASRYPGRIASLVLVGTTTPYLRHADDNPQGIPLACLEAFGQTLLTDYPRWIDENMDPFVPGASAGMKDWIRAMALEGSLHALLACNRTLTTEDLRAELPTVDLPALVLHGDRDASSPIDLTARPTAALLPNARLEVFEGATHGLAYTHAERLNRRLLDFCADPYAERPRASRTTAGSTRPST